MSYSIILVRPQSAGNIGSVARSMKNLGFRDLRLVAPEVPPSHPEAIKMAVHAKDLLENSRIYSTIPEALEGFEKVVGTSRRTGKHRMNWLTASDFVKEQNRLNSEEKIALLFGPEDTGLQKEDLIYCQKLIWIPSHPDYPSYNLSQAVLLVCYEIFISNHGSSLQSRVVDEDGSDRANFETLESMYEDLQAILQDAGFLNKQDPAPMMRRLRNFFNRSQPSEKEVKIFRGIFRQLRWWAQNGEEEK